METIGYIGSLLLGFCGLPTVIESIVRKKCDISYSLIIPWFSGEIICLIYTIYKLGYNPLLWNYIANIIFITIMIYYKRRSK